MFNVVRQIVSPGFKEVGAARDRRCVGTWGDYVRNNGAKTGFFDKYRSQLRLLVGAAENVAAVKHLGGSIWKCTDREIIQCG